MARDSSLNPSFDPKAFLRTVTTQPGVYRMYDLADEVIYVGKAKNLKKRLSSYFRSHLVSEKTRQLVTQIQRIETTITHTEMEALLLEYNLIKQYQPRYNVLLKDGKGYPYIFISSDPYPKLSYHRGSRSGSGHYFGPYPSGHAVKQTLYLLQKLFKLRQCEESFFRNRSRPCLQYQIKRCKAPCVERVSPQEYLRDVRNSRLFLEGKSHEVIDELIREMENASNALQFEKAAIYRDQIAALRKIQERQYINGERGNLDVVACHTEAGQSCIQLFFIRNGRNLGNRPFFPNATNASNEQEVLYAFLTQYYLQHEIPAEILISHALDDEALVTEVLSEKVGSQVSLSHSLRGERRRWMEMALINSKGALLSRLASHSGMSRRLKAVQKMLKLEQLPQRLECFDISHSQGEATVASCVVFNAEGPLKSDYRRFNITGITRGDDYAAMEQALSRCYSRRLQEDRPLPDVIFIDGGKGQLAKAEAVIAELQFDTLLVGVAKGPSRRPGEEQLFLHSGKKPIHYKRENPGLHLIQQIRDEAHRFAIAGHRGQRAKRRVESPLEQISGLGPKRRQALLKHFGGMQGILRVSSEELARVPGISTKLAKMLYDALHSG